LQGEELTLPRILAASFLKMTNDEIRMMKECQMPYVKAAARMTARVSSFEPGDSLVIGASSFVIPLPTTLKTAWGQK
jgi:hypothetical protein